MPSIRNKNIPFTHPNTPRRTFLQSVAAAALAYGTSASFVFANESQPIRIGALVPLTGPLGGLGQTILNGIRYAVDLHNSSGGILGRPIQFLFEDSAAKPSVAIDKLQKLHKQNHIDMLTGVISTPVTFAIQDYIKKEHLLYINSTSGSDDIMLPEHRSPYFFHAKSNHSQSTLPTKYLSQQQKPNAKWYFIGSDYAWGHDGVAKLKHYAAEGNDIQVVGTQFVPLDVSDFGAVVSRIAPLNPDIIAMAIVGQGYPGFIKQVRFFGIKSHLHHDYMSLIEAGGAGRAAIGLTGGISYAMEDSKSPTSATFAKAFYGKYNAWPEMGAVSGATAINMYVEAIKLARSTEQDKIIKVLETTELPDVIRGGHLRFRECDHQIELPMYLMQLTEVANKISDGMTVLHHYTVDKVTAQMPKC